MGNCFSQGKSRQSLGSAQTNIAYTIKQVSGQNVRRTLKIVQQKYKHFDLEMIMDEFDGSLAIKIQNTSTFDCYQLIINDKRIGEQKSLKYFDKATQIFNYLLNHFSRVTVEDSLFKFDYAPGNTWKNATAIVLKARKLEIQLSKKEEMMMKKVKQQVAAETLIKDNLIKELQKKLQLQQQMNKQLRQKLEKESKNLKYSDRNSDIQRGKFSQRTSFQQKNCIDHHLNNSHQQFYNLSAIKTSCSKITKKTKGWHNFMNKFEIVAPQKVKYSVKLGKVTGNSLLVGFCTSKGLDNASYNHSESAYYFCQSPGSVNEGGTSKVVNIVPKDGDIIDCFADIENNTLIWSNNGNKFFQCFIPSQMKNKKVYFSIFMYYANDYVELSI